jgi:4-hydroxy-3-methylbut-2-en-1-yl diphosphate synthase IspG/GcpE
MEITISAALMKVIMENSDDTIKPFVSTDRDKEIVQGIQIMESMGIRQIEVDLTEDDSSLLH